MQFFSANTNTLLNVMQCLNVILNNSTKSSDLIFVINKENQMNLPSIRRNVYEEYVVRGFFQRKPDFYLIEYLTETQIGYFCEEEEKYDYTFNPKAKYLFLAKNFTIKFLNLISSYFIYNAIFFDSTTNKIFSYAPYKENYINVVDNEFIEVGYCENNGSVTLTAELYPPKIPKEWKNASIRIIYTPMAIFTLCHDCEKKGIDIEVFELIAESHGINIEYERINSEDNFDNFYKNIHNVHIGAQIMRISVEYTYPHFYDKLVWFVPQPQLVPRWKYVSSIFSFPVWSMWILTTAVLTLTWCFGEFLLKRHISFWTILTVPDTIFNCFLENTATMVTNTSFQATLILCILFLSTMMNFFFKSRLTYFLNGLNYEQGINSVEDVMSNDLKVGCTQLARHMISVDSKLKEHLDRNFIECSSYNCLNRTAFVGDQATVTLMALIRSNYIIYIDETTNRSLLKFLLSPIYWIPLVSHFNKGHPMFSLFNENLQRLLETGVIEKISRKYFNDRKLEEIQLSATQKLNFSHIVGPLSVWMVGIVLSVITFFLELVSFNVRSYNKECNIDVEEE